MHNTAMTRRRIHTLATLARDIAALGVTTRKMLRKTDEKLYSAARAGGWLDKLLPLQPQPEPRKPKATAKPATAPTIDPTLPRVF